MRLLIVGIGHMGSWLAKELSNDHEVGIFDTDSNKMKHDYNVIKFKKLEEATDFKPQMVINAVSLQNTIHVYREILKFISTDCIFADITSVKIGLEEFYCNEKLRFVSTHPMFGPTFANISDLQNENAIIIKQSDKEGKEFFKDFFQKHNILIHEYSFEEHDKTIAYSLATPFVSSIVFAACMVKQNAPGTTFKKHENIAKGLLAEDDYLLAEILFNPYTIDQINRINSQLSFLTHIIRDRDFDEMKKLLNKLRKNIVL